MEGKERSFVFGDFLLTLLTDQYTIRTIRTIKCFILIFMLNDFTLSSVIWACTYNKMNIDCFFRWNCWLFIECAHTQTHTKTNWDFPIKLNDNKLTLVSPVKRYIAFSNTICASHRIASHRIKNDFDFFPI